MADSSVACAEGFAQDQNGGCDDIDECTTDQHACDPLRSCLNTDGGYRCGSCPTGYVEEGTGCADIDECRWSPSPCQGPARCINAIGSYGCECLPGYSPNLVGHCIDNDECADETASCDDVAFCRNSLGSFSCACPAYYQDEQDGGLCRNTRYQATTTLVNGSGGLVAPDRDGNLLLVSAFAATTRLGAQSLTSAGGLDLVAAKFNAAREVVWVRQFGGTGEDWVEWVKADGAGDLIFAGQTGGGFTMGCAMLSALGSPTRYVAKLRNADGACVWSRLLPHAGVTMQDDFWLTLDIDQADNVFVAGEFQGTLDIGANHLSSAGGSDIYVAKFSAAGGVLWARSWGNAAAAASHGIATYADGSFALFGSFSGSLSLGGEEFTSRGESDLVLAKLTPDGDHLWSRQDGGVGSDWGGTVAVDAAGNALIGGYFYGQTILGDDQLRAAGAWDMFVTKIDPEGATVWTRDFGGSGDDLIWAVATDDHRNVYATGPFNGPLDFGEGERAPFGGAWDIFVVKLDPDGQHLWSQPWGGLGWDTAGYLMAGAGGKLYITGFFEPPVDFGGGPQTTGSAFVIELSP